MIPTFRALRLPRDVLPRSFCARNAIERENYRMYDATAMEGLPVGVVVVGKRPEEERVLEAMKLIEGLMKGAGLGYVGIPLWRASRVPGDVPIDSGYCIGAISGRTVPGGVQ
ncbi:hypothetical protein PAXRUDRAFT_826614 [Paxillus rubicundulus Ve08.2h10]|uniref:Amidase n=1 Tax=Paxillus rubicundulus Ve08.2h10 TaxID=930991 RepID=A0A0D0E431_9AGAM|nr:hypothetical protein PAXRUDRAFT_826614 [Paxillus rubicundulus Ve08.2h10]